MAGKEAYSEKKGFLPVEQIWWSTGVMVVTRGSKEWTGTGPELEGAVRVEWLWLVELCSDHFCM